MQAERWCRNNEQGNLEDWRHNSTVGRATNREDARWGKRVAGIVGVGPIYSADPSNRIFLELAYVFRASNEFNGQIPHDVRNRGTRGN